MHDNIAATVARQPVGQEPVAWFSESGYGGSRFVSEKIAAVEDWIATRNKDQGRRGVSEGYRQRGPFPLYAAAPAVPVGITADWVLGYLASDAPEALRETILDAFNEYAALATHTQPTAGWEFARDGEAVQVIAPNCDPGATWLVNRGTLEKRLLYALVSAIIDQQTKPTDEVQS